MSMVLVGPSSRKSTQLPLYLAAVVKNIMQVIVKDSNNGGWWTSLKTGFYMILSSLEVFTMATSPDALIRSFLLTVFGALQYTVHHLVPARSWITFEDNKKFEFVAILKGCRTV